MRDDEDKGKRVFSKTHETANDLSRIAMTVLATGVVCIVAVPLLLTNSGFTFDETGEIGDTIGGVTAPISSLVGSVLVFLALKGQIVANRVTLEQIRDQQLEEERKKEINYVSDLYKYFLSCIQSYETKYYKGHRAIMRVMRSLAESERKTAHDENRLYYGTAAELYGILKLGKMFVEHLNQCRLEEQDKRYFKGLLKHHYDSFIIPYLAKNNKTCAVCGEKHNGIPSKMLGVIHETVHLL